MKLRLPLLADFYDYTGAARRLEKLARKGWLLRNVGGWFWTFERTQPRELRYSVVYFPEVSDLDPSPKTELLDYIAMCEAAGWELAARQNQRLIFRTADPDAVPIDTDPVIQLDTIHKVMKKTHVRGYALVIGLLVFYLLRDIGELGDYGCYFLADPFDVMFLGMEALLLLAAVIELVSYFLWLRRARRGAERGEFLPSKKTLLLSLLELSIFPVGLLILAVLLRDSRAVLPIVSLFAILLLTQTGLYWLGKFFKKQGYDEGSNRIMQMGIMCVVLFGVLMLWATKTADYVEQKNHEAAAGYVELNGYEHYYNDHDLPLTLEDLGMEEGDAVYDRTLEMSSSPLMSITQGLHRPVLFWLDESEDLPALDYALTVSKVSWLRAYMKEEKLVRYEIYGDAVARPWDAERVLKDKRKGTNHYVVFWEDRVLEINFSEEPTEEQIGIVTACMKGGDFG